MSVPSTWVSKTEIVAGLHRLGIAQGSLLEVHASLRSLGQVDGGADAVIEALMETVGEQGAIVMPSYPVGPGIAASPEEHKLGITWKVHVLLFDDHTTRTGMGVIAPMSSATPTRSFRIPPGGRMLLFWLKAWNTW